MFLQNNVSKQFCPGTWSDLSVTLLVISLTSLEDISFVKNSSDLSNWWVFCNTINKTQLLVQWHPQPQLTCFQIHSNMLVMFNNSGEIAQMVKRQTGVGVPGFKYLRMMIFSTKNWNFVLFHLTWSFMFRSSWCHAAAYHNW